jgi:hypothetical protein
MVYARLKEIKFTRLRAGMMEGWKHLPRRQTTPSYSTGTEDYFNGAWYFLSGRFSAPSRLHRRDLLRGVSPTASTRPPGLPSPAPAWRSVTFSDE